MTNSDASVKAQAELAKRELARRHFQDFVHYTFPGYQENWHHKIIINALEHVEAGLVKRLMLLIPPRHGKSELASIRFPAFYIGKHPEKEIIAASYASDLAVDFGRKTRNLVNTREYANVFRVRLAEDSKSAGKWNTDRNGAYYAVGVGGASTGRGANCLLIDDPVKNREDAESEVIQEKTWDWYRSTARTRLAPGGAIVLIQTRWSDGDLAGHILASEGADEWKVLKFPAIATEDEPYRKIGDPLWPERYPLEELQGIRRDIGPYEWSSLYQQEPIDEASQEFKKTWFKPIEWETVQAYETNAFLTIDTAFSEKESSDYTGVVRNWVNKENKWHLKAYRMRLNPMELIDLLFTLHRQDRYVKIGIEKTAYLQAIKPFLDAEQRKRNVFLPIVELLHHQTQKEIRIRGLVPRYESGSVYHIKVECVDLEEELLRFPKGIHDDVADGAAYQSQVAEPPRKTNYKPLPNTPLTEFETGVDPVALHNRQSRYRPDDDPVSEFEGGKSKDWDFTDAMGL